MEESGHNSGSGCRCISDHEICGTCDAPFSIGVDSGTCCTPSSQVDRQPENLQKTPFYRGRCGCSTDPPPFCGKYPWSHVASPGSFRPDRQANIPLSGDKKRILSDHRPVLHTGGAHSGNSGQREQPVYLYAA